MGKNNSYYYVWIVFSSFFFLNNNNNFYLNNNIFISVIETTFCTIHFNSNYHENILCNERKIICEVRTFIV